MRKQQIQKTQQYIEASTIQIVISIIVLIILIIIFAIQISIIISYYVNSVLGRCIYNDDGKCTCQETTKKYCDNLNGIFNNNLTCSDAAVEDCAKVLLPTRRPLKKNQ